MIVTNLDISIVNLFAEIISKVMINWRTKRLILICYRPVNSGKLLSVDMTAGTKNNAFQSGVL